MSTKVVQIMTKAKLLPSHRAYKQNLQKSSSQKPLGRFLALTSSKVVQIMSLGSTISNCQNAYTLGQFLLNHPS
jgi:predicted patatin/cPLA2 family phospholipase